MQGKPRDDPSDGARRGIERRTQPGKRACRSCAFRRRDSLPPRRAWRSTSFSLTPDCPAKSSRMMNMACSNIFGSGDFTTMTLLEIPLTTGNSSSSRQRFFSKHNRFLPSLFGFRRTFPNRSQPRRSRFSSLICAPPAGWQGRSCHPCSRSARPPRGRRCGPEHAYPCRRRRAEYAAATYHPPASQRRRLR